MCWYGFHFLLFSSSFPIFIALKTFELKPFVFSGVCGGKASNQAQQIDRSIWAPNWTKVQRDSPDWGYFGGQRIRNSHSPGNRAFITESWRNQNPKYFYLGSSWRGREFDCFGRIFSVLFSLGWFSDSGTMFFSNNQDFLNAEFKTQSFWKPRNKKRNFFPWFPRHQRWSTTQSQRLNSDKTLR